VASHDSARKRLAEYDLTYTVAPDEWLVGAPLGNGHLGVMLWGDGDPLCLTLDRDDLWDEREYPVDDPDYTWETVSEAARAGDYARVNEILERNLTARPDAIEPAKLPLGRLEIGAGGGSFSGRLHLGDATYRGKIGDVAIDACVAAESPIMVVQLRNCTSEPDIAWRSLAELNAEAATSLKILEPERHAGDAGEAWIEQEFSDGSRAVIAWRTLRRGSAITLLATIATTRDIPDPAALARQRLVDAMHQTTRILGTHVDWWREFWDRSRIDVPDHGLATLWHYGLYKLASSSRSGHYPANLQGLWVTDGVIPPWRGEYAANMNVQETYWPVYATNHLDLGLPLYEWLERITPVVRERTKQFFGWDGLRIESALVGDGVSVPGWGTVQFWPGVAAWLAHHMWQHWRYSGDEDFLRNRAYPFLKLCASFWEGYLEQGDDGRLHVPLSHNPEWLGNDPEAWGRDTTIDLALVRSLFAWLIEASDRLGVDADARVRWHDLREHLAPYPANEWGLMLMEGVGYTFSHRHPSHLMPIFPMHDLTMEGSDEEREIVERSMHCYEYNGTGEWTGWSFPYASLIASRVGRGEMAGYMLKLYLESFTMPNGMHVNGDWRGHGVSHYHYRPFTMEAECAATSAVTEMLLQSWGGRIRLFPAVPPSWLDCSFDGLLAEGAITVGAERRAGETVRASLSSRADAGVTIAGLSRDVDWSGAKSAEWDDGLWRVELVARQEALATLPREGDQSEAQRKSKKANVFGFHGWDVA